jgi:PAS domain S-box-containing protein
MGRTATEILSGDHVFAPLSQWDTPQLTGHSVQFYEEDSFLLDEISRFLGSAIGSGDAALAVTTEAHREGLYQRLKERGIDLHLAVRRQRFLWLDAASLLQKFMVGDMPNPTRFLKVLGSLIEQFTPVVNGEKRRLAVFGEMVALLWAEGNHDAAVRLEELWNQLSQTYFFQLHCAYPLRLFSRPETANLLAKICSEHSAVVPSERYTEGLTAEERLRAIVLLQQKAQALEVEINERKRAQQALEESENELKDYLENAVIGMHWVAADGTILWANKAELALVGYERDEYIGHHISEFHADSDVIQDILARMGRNEQLHGYESQIRRKDGSLRHVRIDSNAFMRNGQFAHTRCFTTDITDKKEAERSQSRLAAIVESSDDAIISKDLNGIITSWNKGAERIFGYKPEEIIGKSILLLIPPELHADETMILARIRAGERINHFQTVRLRKNGERLDASLTVSPIRDRQGKVIGAAKILRDITQQKKLESALHTTERLALVGRLAATIAHEINNPLEAVTNFIYIARNSPEISEQTRQYLESADRELRRAAHIAQQTLGFYRDTSQPVLLDVSRMVEDVLAIYERKFKYKQLCVEREIEPEMKICAWQGELKQVLSNLITNALDASKEGGRIVIRARSSRNIETGNPEIRFTIADNGLGISNETKGNLFRPFFTTKKTVGTGLGLWITKDLLEKRGGRISLRSRCSDPSGTTITFCLPALQAAVKTNWPLGKTAEKLKRTA